MFGYVSANIMRVGGHIFRCNYHESSAYICYCNILHWEKALLGYNPCISLGRRSLSIWESVTP